MEYTKTKTKNGKVIKMVYLAQDGRTIQYGDILEAKQLVGGYGETEVFKGKLDFIDSFGAFFLETEEGRKRVGVNSELDFKKTTDDLFIFNTSTSHGYGAYDAHAHTTYVKII